MKAILTYHASRLDSLDSRGCDLLRLQEDLILLADSGTPVLPLDTLLAPDCQHGIAITFDDGTRIDAEEHEHPRLGRLPSMLGLLIAARPRLPQLRASTFVIASPQARADLSQALESDYGQDLMHERWWRAAAGSGVLDIENHSWDHNHPIVQRSAQRNNERGNFLLIETEAEAEAEITTASDYIENSCGRRPRYFAYPFGDMSDYLRHTWLPRRGPQIGLHAAFSTEAQVFDHSVDRWAIPRYVAGRDWQDASGLLNILDQLHP